MGQDRKYVIINKSDLDNINYNEILQSSKETVITSVDETFAIIKYNGIQPPSVSSLSNKSQEYTNSEIHSIMSGPNWKKEEPL